MTTALALQQDPTMRRAENVLRENLRSLLLHRGAEQKDLAQWCGHAKSWINKFLNGSRGLAVDELDRLADFFGLTAHQLFQPGISPMTERRKGTDRRTTNERRLGPEVRLRPSIE